MTILEWRNAVSKSKFNARTERKLIQTAKANTGATSHALKIFLQANGLNVWDFSIYRKLISTGLSARGPRKKANVKFAVAKKRLDWANVEQEQFRNN